MLRNFDTCEALQLAAIGSHDFTRIIPAASSLSSSILSTPKLAIQSSKHFKTRSHPKQQKNPFLQNKADKIMTKGWAAPSGSFLVSNLSQRSPVCINHCGQQPSEFFLRSKRKSIEPQKGLSLLKNLKLWLFVFSKPSLI